MKRKKRVKKARIIKSFEKWVEHWRKPENYCCETCEAGLKYAADCYRSFKDRKGKIDWAEQEKRK